MDITTYRSYYIDFIRVLGGAIVREKYNDSQRYDKNPALEQNLQNKIRGIIVLSLVSLIESNFLTKPDLKLLRNFQSPTTVIPSLVNQNILSCFIYIRDSFAHDPSSKLLNTGVNTTGFINAISQGTFSYANINAQSIAINPDAVHELHLIVLRFFGENV